MGRNSMMRTVVVVVLWLCLIPGIPVLAGRPLPEVDRLVGVWLTESKDQVKIYKEAGKYFGKGVETPANKGRLDDKNPDERLRTRRLADVVILKNFEYLGGNRWGKGTIYDPNNGKTYKCTITMKSEDRIKVRGFIGISLLGRTEIWPRVAAQ